MWQIKRITKWVIRCMGPEVKTMSKEFILMSHKLLNMNVKKRVVNHLGVCVFASFCVCVSEHISTYIVSYVFIVSSFYLNSKK